MDTMLFIGKFVFLRNSAPIGKKEHKKLGELRENSSKGITLKDHRRYNINNQAEQSNTKFKVSSTFSTAGGSAVFREAFRVSKRLQRHNTKVLLDFFLKNRGWRAAPPRSDIIPADILCATDKHPSWYASFLQYVAIQTDGWCRPLKSEKLKDGNFCRLCRCS